jgi:transposase
VETRVKWVGRGRGGANRTQEVVEHIRYQITAVSQNQEAKAAQMATLGWRAYATNAPEQRLSLVQGVQEYRQEYHVERSFGCLKGSPLSIAPLFVQRDDQVAGLTHLLSLALRVLTLMEFVVRRRLKQQGMVLVGLYKESPRKATSTPTAERLLQAFVPMTLTTVQLPGRTICHVAALSLVQAQILQLLGLPADLYACLASEIPQTAFLLRE